MFETLSDRLGNVFDRLRGRGALTESDVVEALREVRVALLEADVALPVVKDFIARVKERAVGQDVLRSVTPGQQVVKIVHDELIAMLGTEASGISLDAPAPVAILMVGLQGSGKTTTTAKIARRLTERERKKVLMASLDVRRPAAQEQLRVLGEQTGVATLPIVAGQMPVAIARRAIEAARLGGFDVVMLDTAGRLAIDEQLMQEVAEVHAAADPHEVLLVADALTGQDAVEVARRFKERLPVSGIVLTRLDGDGRGGAALSMRAVTGAPIKFAGVGEKLDALEPFHPERVAGRILGMGDVVGLVEKAAETIDREKAEKIARKMKKGEFDLDDLREQLSQMRKIGGMRGVLSLLPGMGKMKSQLADANLDEGLLKRQEAIITSMTKLERRTPKILNGSRKKRIASGAGVEVSEVNRLIKMHRQMADMMKKMGKKGMQGLFGKGMPADLPMDGAPEIDPAVLGRLPGGLPGLGGPGLPGLGGTPLPRSKKRK
jgi:signal recognition particle subunit SRP54